MQFFNTDTGKGFSFFNQIEFHIVKRKGKIFQVRYNFNIQLVLELTILNYTLAIFFNFLDLPLHSKYNKTLIKIG